MLFFSLSLYIIFDSKRTRRTTAILTREENILLDAFLFNQRKEKKCFEGHNYGVRSDG